MLFGLFHRRRLRVDIASVSECGPVRAENQDHVLVNRRGLAFCVADGMGGGEGGGVASEIVCRRIASALSKRVDFADRVKRVDEAVRSADKEVREYAAQKGFKQMGTTATVLIVDGDDAAEVAVGNIGDSRVYRLRQGSLVQLTVDHNMSCELRRRGTGRGQQGQLADIRAAMLSHVLTRAVGVGDVSKLDWRKFDMREGDMFLLCSDGVHGAMSDKAIQGALTTASHAREAVAILREFVLASGAHDNFSAIVVKIGGRK